MYYVLVKMCVAFVVELNVNVIPVKYSHSLHAHTTIIIGSLHKKLAKGAEELKIRLEVEIM